MPEVIIHIINNAGHAAVLGGILMTIQVSALIVLFTLADLALKKRARTALRYAMWMLVVAKLFLPPGLVSPSSVAYWVVPRVATPIRPFQISPVTVTITENPAPITPAPVVSTPFVPLAPSLGFHAALLAVWLAGSITLACWILWRHREIRRLFKDTSPAPAPLVDLMADCARRLGLKQIPQLRQSRSQHSPVLYGILSPVILLPEALVGQIGTDALKDVLSHELIHLRRRDPWLNCLQVAAQVIWWWNPLVWLANARIRALRETAVDEAVMLDGDGDNYPSTLVKVARYCTRPPLLSLAFLGILESPSRLEKRVRRLIDSPLPRSATLNWTGWLVVTVAALSLLPMNFVRRVEAASETSPAVAAPTTTSPWEKWSDSAVAETLQAGRPVVVEFSTDWATSSMIQRRTVLENQHVLTALELSNARLLRADCTSSNAVIEAKLRSFGAVGVPLFAIYTPDNGDEPLLVTNQITQDSLLDTLSTQLAPLSLRLAGAKRQLAELHSRYQNAPPAVSAASNKVARLETLSAKLGGQENRLAPTAKIAGGNPFHSDPELMRRYGLMASAEPTVAPAPQKRPQYNMSPELMKRYGLNVANVKHAPETTAANQAVPEAQQDQNKPAYQMSPELMKRYGLIPPLNSELQTRVFALNPRIFFERLSVATRQPIDDSTDVSQVIPLLRKHLAARGLQFEGQNSSSDPLTPPWALFLNAQGKLFVRAPQAYLAGFEKELNALNEPPQQVVIEVKWADIASKTATTVPLPPTTNGAKFLLTAGQTKAFIAQLEQKDGVDLLSAPKVTTLSGREAEISVQEVKTVVTGKTPATESSPETVQYVNLETGPKIRLLPTVSKTEENAIHIKASPQVVEFLGYVEGKDPTPLIRTNSATGAATLWDGQTFGMSLGTITNITRMSDKVPVLGDIPLVGRFFRSENANTNVAHRIVLITPRLIDPAGNAVNREGSPPLNLNSFPTKDGNDGSE